MNLHEHTTQAKLLKYAFYYNEARLVLAGLTLLLGKMSPILVYFSIPVITPLAGSLVGLAWILSGVAAGYMLYLWFQSGQTLWGRSELQDRVAFAVSVITGLHLGWAGLFGTNIGFYILPFLGLLMPIGGLLYLWSAFHLFKRYKSDKDMFNSPAEATAQPQQNDTTQ